MPTATKNSVAKISRTGMMSASTCSSNSDSETTIPARKAPRPSDNPAACVARATPRAMATTASMKSSREPDRATMRSSGGTSRVPRRNAAIRTTAEISSDSAMPKPPPRWPAMTGMSASIGARLKSWTMPRPSATRACGLSISPRPMSILSATIELEMAKAPPSRSAAPNVQPPANPAAVPRSTVSGIWIAPPSSAARRTRITSLRENSTPSPNIRSATPRFASSCTRSTSATRPGVFGPMTSPARM